MVKLALRVKRRFSKLRGRGNREARPKTFSSKEAADAWAKANNIKSYELENLRSEESSTQKIRVVVDE
jgi:hypothetical protein